jgi:N5-(cytidine 5'-diphosphoramidyl)-L-glutamine hydrolase
MLVGITQRVDKVESRNEYRDSLDQRLVDWVVNLGFLPVPIPNTMVDIGIKGENQADLDNWLKVVRINAIILSGGNDIGNVERRDLTERYLLSWAEKNKKPVLGICRGMQIMGVYAGVSLIKVDGHVGTSHQLLTSNHNSPLPGSVNSFHNSSLEKCPDKFQVIANSKDGHIEAIKHRDLRWEGWMWHPEREAPFNEIDNIRLKRLINDEK